MTRLALLATSVVLIAVPLLAQKAEPKPASDVPPPALVVLKKAEPAVRATAAASKPAVPAPVTASKPDSPLVAAAKRSRRASSGKGVVITNDTLVRSGVVNFPSSAESQRPLSLPQADIVAPSPGVSVADQQRPFTPAMQLAPHTPVKPGPDAATQKRRAEQLIEAYDTDAMFADTDPARVEKVLDDAAKAAAANTASEKQNKPH